MRRLKGSPRSPIPRRTLNATEHRRRQTALDRPVEAAKRAGLAQIPGQAESTHPMRNSEAMAGGVDVDRRDLSLTGKRLCPRCRVSRRRGKPVSMRISGRRRRRRLGERRSAIAAIV